MPLFINVMILLFLFSFTCFVYDWRKSLTKSSWFIKELNLVKHFDSSSKVLEEDLVTSEVRDHPNVHFGFL